MFMWMWSKRKQFTGIKKLKRKSNPSETRGRPTLKTEDRTEKIMELAKQGKTNEEIANIVGINVRTLYDWKVQDWAFSSALKENQALADDVVEASTYKNAVGFTYFEEASTKDGVQRLEKYNPPNATSQIFWLKNRRPKNWKDKVDLDQSTPLKLIIQKSDGNSEEL